MPSKTVSSAGLRNIAAGVTVWRSHGMLPKYQTRQKPSLASGLLLSSCENDSISPMLVPVASLSTSRTYREQNSPRECRLNPVSYRIPDRFSAAWLTRKYCSGVSAVRMRRTETRPRSDLATNFDHCVVPESGNRLSPIVGSAPDVSTTTPTWFVHEFVARATSRNGLAPTRMNTTSPTLSVEASADAVVTGRGMLSESRPYIWGAASAHVEIRAEPTKTPARTGMLIETFIWHHQLLQNT